MKVEQLHLELERVQKRARRVRHEKRFGGIEVNETDLGRFYRSELRLRRSCQQSERHRAHEDAVRDAYEQDRRMLSQVRSRGIGGWGRPKTVGARRSARGSPGRFFTKDALPRQHVSHLHAANRGAERRIADGARQRGAAHRGVRVRLSHGGAERVVAERLADGGVFDRLAEACVGERRAGGGIFDGLAQRPFTDGLPDAGIADRLTKRRIRSCLPPDFRISTSKAFRSSALARACLRSTSANALRSSALVSDARISGSSSALRSSAFSSAERTPASASKLRASTSFITRSNVSLWRNSWTAASPRTTSLSAICGAWYFCAAPIVPSAPRPTGGNPLIANTASVIAAAVASPHITFLVIGRSSLLKRMVFFEAACSSRMRAMTLRANPGGGSAAPSSSSRRETS